MECCQNAVIFWDNQKEAEIRYNEFLNKELSTKLQSETGKNRESLLSAESQISVLSSRLETASEEIESHKQEIIELHEKCNQKSREKSKLQELYNSLKRKYENKTSDSTTSLRYSKVFFLFFKIWKVAEPVVGVNNGMIPVKQNSLFQNSSQNVSAFKPVSKIEKKTSPSFLQGKKTDSLFSKSQRLLNLQRPKTPNLFNY
jgi:predicted RNase H-like nuclease (RuvC/YqgF family)